MKITNGTITRTVILAIALINQILTTTGHSPLPIEDEAVIQLISLTTTIVASTIAWWKNNSFTQKAIKADLLSKQINKF